MISSRRFSVTESSNVELRAEMFNLFNHSNFANPASTLGKALGTGANLLQPGLGYTQAAAARPLAPAANRQRPSAWARAGNFSSLCA